jgi:hypothetical protein
LRGNLPNGHFPVPHPFRKTGVANQVKRLPRKDIRPKHAKTPKPRTRKRRRHTPQSQIELPRSQAETEVVLLSVDPHLIYAYWDVTPADLKRTKRRAAKEFEGAAAVLRFHDLTGIVERENIPQNYFDVEIDLEARNWFVPLWSSGRTYRVQLGFRTPGGRFLSLALSNIAFSPSAALGEDTEERYIQVTDDHEILEFPGEPASVELLVDPTKHSELQHIPNAVMQPAKTSIPEYQSCDDDRNRAGREAEGDLIGHRTRDMPQVIQEKPPEPAEFRKGSRLLTGKGVAAVSEFPGPHPKENREFPRDLAAWCETQFSLGISSRLRSQD